MMDIIESLVGLRIERTHGNAGALTHFAACLNGEPVSPERAEDILPALAGISSSGVTGVRLD